MLRNNLLDLHRAMVFGAITVLAATTGCASVQEAVEALETGTPESDGVAQSRPPADGQLLVTQEVYTGRIDHADEVDEFRFEGQKGQEIQVFLQGLSERPAIGVDLEFLNTTGTSRLAGVESRGNAKTLNKNSTHVVRLPESGTYVIRVEGDFRPDRPNPYRFQIHELDRKPEMIGSQAEIGQSVEGESIDLPHDMDEYLFQGLEGQEVQVFLQGLSGHPAIGVDLKLMNPGGTSRLAGVGSRGNAKTLNTNSTHVVRLPETGTYVVRVEGDFRPDRPNPYRFLVHEQNRKPEAIGGQVGIGQSVEGETIDLPHDVDEYRFEGRAGQEIQVFLQGLSGHPAIGVDLRLMNPGETRRLTGVESRGNAKTLQENATNVVRLPESGTYVIRVAGDYRPDRPNPYRFQVVYRD